MRIFVSWSKPLSKAIAESFAEWLPTVIQECRNPFLSSDISKGEAWFSTIVDELSEASIGVVFVTSENQTEPWLHFEAGAMVKKLERQKVCPVMVDLKKTDYDGPLTNLQLTELLDRSDFFSLIKDINNCCDHPLEEAVLQEAFDSRWDRFNQSVRLAISEKQTASSAKPQRTQADKVDEILEIVRDLRTQSSASSDLVNVGEITLRKLRGARLGNSALEKRIANLQRVEAAGYSLGDRAYVGNTFVGLIVDVMDDGTGRPLVMTQLPGRDDPTAHASTDITVISSED